MNNYILKHRKPILCDDIIKAVKWLECRRTIRKTYITDDLFVSTVFLVFDHRWGEGSPILFETMIFGLDNDYQTRCCTHRQALKMHKNAVLFAKGYIKGLFHNPNNR
jgi:hypothetical protein